GGHDEPRGAEAALHRTCVDERLLHRMDAVVAVQPLDGHDLVAVDLRGEHEAGADKLAVEQHGARAAFSLLTCVFRPWKPEALAQREEEALALPDVRLVALPVDVDCDPHAAK